MARSNGTTLANHCSSDDYITGDNDLPICAEFDDPDWDRTFIKGLTAEDMETAEQEECDVDETEYDTLPPPPKIKSVGEAALALQDVQAFLEDRSEFDLASPSSNLIDKIAVLNVTKNKQTTIDNFFMPVSP